MLYPRPQWLSEKGSEDFLLSPDTALLASPAGAEEATRLQAWLARECGLALPIQGYSEGRRGIVVGRLGEEAIQAFCRQHSIRVDGRETAPAGYLLDIGRDHVLLAGADAAGAFYGLQALDQLLPGEGRPPRLPGIEIRDWPYKALRGVHLYMPGRRQLPFFKRFLEFLAALRYNTIFLEVGGGLRYDRHPEINRGWEEFVATAVAFPGGPRGLQRSQPFPKDSTHTELGGGSFLEKAEVCDLLAYARSLHIEAIPEVPSLSHAYYLCWPHRELAERQDDPYPDTCCPSNPATYELLFDVMEEVIEVFQPRLIHAGHDEVYTYGLCPRCHGQSPADLLAGEINRIHDFLAGKGIRMAMWGDKLMSIIVGGDEQGGRTRRASGGGGWFAGDEYVMAETYPAVEQVAKDILILDWYWELDPRSQQYFGDKGFEEIFGNFGQNFGPHTFTGWRQRSAAEHVVGAEVSTWCDASEYALGRNACLFNMMFSAEMLWWQHYGDRERGRVLEAIAARQPLLRDRLGARSSPSLAPGARFTPFPFLGAGVLPFAGLLPQGPVELAGHPFSLAPSQVVAVDRSNPEAGPIPVGARLDSLLFLHGCHGQREYRPTWDFADPTRPSPEDLLGWYRVLYAGGGEELVEIRYGENIAAWELQYGEDIAATCYWAEPAWEGHDHEGRPATLYRFEWLNPHPEREIVAVQLRSAGGDGEIALLALTGVQRSAAGS